MYITWQKIFMQKIIGLHQKTSVYSLVFSLCQVDCSWFAMITGRGSLATMRQLGQHIEIANIFAGRFKLSKLRLLRFDEKPSNLAPLMKVYKLIL
jgi:hypothetical protein